MNIYFKLKDRNKIINIINQIINLNKIYLI